jgi:hypothetical protein
MAPHCHVCGRRAKFGRPGGERERCGRHRSPDQVEVALQCHCGRPAHWGPPNADPQRCAVHKEKGVDWADDGGCVACHVTLASFAPASGRAPTHCLRHKPDGYIDVKTRLCHECEVVQVNKAGTSCRTCRGGAWKAAEMAILGLLRQHARLRDFACHDRALPTRNPADRAFRPDVIWLAGERCVLILEIDEHEHRRYAARDEIERERAIVRAYSGHYVIFVRYNPHAPESVRVSPDGCIHGRLLALLLEQRQRAADGGLPATGFERVLLGSSQLSGGRQSWRRQSASSMTAATIRRNG